MPAPDTNEKDEANAAKNTKKRKDTTKKRNGTPIHSQGPAHLGRDPAHILHRLDHRLDLPRGRRDDLDVQVGLRPAEGRVELMKDDGEAVVGGQTIPFVPPRACSWSTRAENALHDAWGPPWGCTCAMLAKNVFFPQN